MDLLGELKLCNMAIDSLKSNYLEHFLEEDSNTKKINDLITGQYIAYASCHSILLDLIEKYEKREDN